MSQIYRLRGGQITEDNEVPEGYALKEQRLDETEVGEGTTVTLINAARSAEWKQTGNPYDCAEWLGLNPWAGDSTSWASSMMCSRTATKFCSYLVDERLTVMIDPLCDVLGRAGSS